MPIRKRSSRCWQFLAGAAVLIAVPLLLGGCKPKEEPAPDASTTGEVPAPTAAVNTRVEIATFTPAQIDALRKGIALMQSRPATDPTSWIYQANIHGVPGSGDNCPANTDPVQEAWATCQHGNFYFLAWHRMYLYYFEEILRAAIREATGDPNAQFALPYWDYATHQLPVPFTTPADATNSLYVAQRRAICNTPTAGQECVTAEQASSTDALGLFPFCNCPDGQASCDGCTAGLTPDETFGGEFTPAPVHFMGQFGELESQPHNVIHNRVGGSFGWMSDANCAARDPIFWLHHANIDRLWQVWLNQNSGRVNPLGSTAWTTQKFTFFDGTGAKVEKTGCDILNMVTQLNYEYQGLPVQNVVLCTESAQPAPQPEAAPASTPMTELAASPATGFNLGSAPLKVAVPVPANMKQRITTLAESAQPEKLRLVIEGLTQLKPGGVYEVYLNLPAGQAPDPKGPYFVGDVALFGHAGHGTESSRSFDVSDEMHDLQQKGEWKGEVNLTFVLSGGEEPRTGTQAAPGNLLRFRRATLVTRQQ